MSSMRNVNCMATAVVHLKPDAKTVHASALLPMRWLRLILHVLAPDKQHNWVLAKTLSGITSGAGYTA
jgi:hypothetical protein